MKPYAIFLYIHFTRSSEIVNHPSCATPSIRTSLHVDREKLSNSHGQNKTHKNNGKNNIERL